MPSHWSPEMNSGVTWNWTNAAINWPATCRPTAACAGRSSRSTSTLTTVAEGSGAMLVADAVDRARSRGCYRVQLTSNLARSDAHRFYERLGFVPSHVGFKLRLE